MKTQVYDGLWNVSAFTIKSAGYSKQLLSVRVSYAAMGYLKNRLHINSDVTYL